MKMSRILILIGVFLILIGLILRYAPGLINWFGKLPGDIYIDKENVKVFIPVTSMIIVSILFSVILRIIQRFME